MINSKRNNTEKKTRFIVKNMFKKVYAVDVFFLGIRRNILFVLCIKSCLITSVYS